jgi:hypothetical protein
MAVLTAELFMVGVRAGFRIGREVRHLRRDKARTEKFRMAMGEIGAIDLETASLNRCFTNRTLRAKYGALFPYDEPAVPHEARAANRALVAQAIEEGAKDILGDRFDQISLDQPLTLDQASNIVSITPLQTEAGQNTRRRRLAWTVIDIALELVAAQPNVLGLRGDAEKLMGAMARHISDILPDDPVPDDDSNTSFTERALAVFLDASLRTMAEHPGLIASEEHHAALLKAVVTPLSRQFADANTASGELPALNQLRACLRGPVARGVLQTLSDRQLEFLGSDFGEKTAAGAVTQQILGAALAIEAEDFDIRRAFSPSGLTLVYTAALDAAATHPELFVSGTGEGAIVRQDLLRGIASAMKAAPIPFRTADGETDAARMLGNSLAHVAIDVAVAHASRLMMAEHAGDDPWDIVSRQIIQEIMTGFSDAVGSLVDARAPGAATQAANPFVRLFNQDQAMSIVRLIATQAAATPQMLGATAAKPEVREIAKAVATFLADPETRLASSEDWMLVAAVAVEEAARNPDTLIARVAGPETGANPAGENYLAVHVVRILLSSASNALRANATAPSGRRRGVVLFGDTLREALIATLRAAADNAAILAQGPRHLELLKEFLDQLQDFTQAQGGLGAGEWLWLYKRFVAHVIVLGDTQPIGPDQLREALENGPAGQQGRAA